MIESESIQQDAHRYRLSQAQALIDAYTARFGPPSTLEELEGAVADGLMFDLPSTPHGNLDASVLPANDLRRDDTSAPATQFGDDESLCLSCTGQADPADLHHEQILIAVPLVVGGGEAHVDVKIEPLLQEVWRHGWRTFASCQDWGDGTAQILFDRAHDAMSFVVEVGFTKRVTIRLMTESTRYGPMVDNPVAVYFPRRWIDRATSRLRHQPSSNLDSRECAVDPTPDGRA